MAKKAKHGSTSKARKAASHSKRQPARRASTAKQVKAVKKQRPGTTTKAANTKSASARRESAQEQAYFESVLRANKAISQGGALKPGETHAEERDQTGRSRIVRRRFSAI